MYKIASLRVTPIHKTGAKDDPNNYRPISILPFIGKLIEYFAGQQLTDYMEENRLFTRHQYGFRNPECVEIFGALWIHPGHGRDRR